MTQETDRRRKWLIRFYEVYVVGAALLFAVSWVLVMWWRHVVPIWVFGISFGAAFLAALTSHFVNGRDNWPDSFD